ncbi:MAG: hypothetical protein Q7T49_02405 [bacterium]|nr:hypothetical protein [bacterium]
MELFSAVATAIPRDSDPDRIKRFIEEPRFAKAVLRSVFKPVAIPTNTAIPMEEWHHGWLKFWRHFGFKVDYFEPLYPEQWSIVMPKGLTNTQAFEIRQQMAPSTNYLGNLDKITSVREPDQDYIVYVAPNMEADQEYRNKSACWVAESQINSTTTRESCALHSRYYAETGKFLNVDSITLDAGSRSADGNVPGSDWGRVGAEFGLGYCSLGSAGPFLGIRRVSL